MAGNPMESPGRVTRIGRAVRQCAVKRREEPAMGCRWSLSTGAGGASFSEWFKVIKDRNIWLVVSKCFKHRAVIVHKVLVMLIYL